MTSLGNSGWVNPTFTCCELLRDSQIFNPCVQDPTFGTYDRFSNTKQCAATALRELLFHHYPAHHIMKSQPSKAKALLLPADGSGVRLVSYNIKERDDNDMVDNGLAEFYDPIPDLKTLLDGGYQQRAMASFHVDIKENNNTDPIARAYFPSQDLAAFGQYCLYYTVSSTLPLNETCRRILDIVPPPNRLFWRGDVVVVRYEGHLGMGHVYTDVKEALLGPVEAVLKKVYDCKGLEGVHEEGFSLREEMSKLQARFPALMQAIDIGSLEKLRTNQPLNDIDLQVIHQIPRMNARFPDGSEETIWEPPLKDLAGK